MIENFFRHLAHTPYTPFSLQGSAQTPLIPIASNQLLTTCRQWQSLFIHRSEPVVAVFGRMTPSMISAWLGAILAGKLPVFISYPSHKIQKEEYAEKLANYTQRFGSCLFVAEESERNLATNRLSTKDLDTINPQPQTDWLNHLSPKENPLFLQCGSGTTGLQKAVAITGNQLEHQLKSYADTLNLDPKSDHIASWLPLYHDMGLVAAFLLPLLTHTPFTLIDTFEWSANPLLLLQIIQQQKATLCWLPNFAFALLAKQSAKQSAHYDLSSIRAFINCSEPVSLHNMERFVRTHSLNPQQLAVCYALAENVFAVSQTPIGQAPTALMVDRLALQRKQIEGIQSFQLGDPLPEEKLTKPLFSCGSLLQGVEVHIEKKGQHTVGEVWIRGESSITGYYQHHNLRDDGWTPTGDLGFFYKQQLYLSGRSKDLIIHNGKNIHPQDIEEIVHQHPMVYPGRVTALGWLDESLDSEKIVVLFEPRHPLNLEERSKVIQEISHPLETLFECHCQVVCVPQRWLQKTSSGKMARGRVLQRYLDSKENTIHLCGDSHVRLFWSHSTSHHNLFRHIKAYWLGLLWADNWQKTLPFFLDLIPQFNPKDVLIIHIGEPECRSIFPASKEPLIRIEQSIENYRTFFLTLRKIWRGRLAYMTGIPTHPNTLDNGDSQWPIQGTAHQRYQYQKLFYQRMQTLCNELVIHFIDICTPLLETDGFMNPNRLADKAHLTPKHRDFYLNIFENYFGFIDTQHNPEDTLEKQTWNGTYPHFEQLTKQKITELSMGRRVDWNAMVSNGFLDSLAIIEVIAMLDQVCGFSIQPETVSRQDFESLENIYQKFAPKQT